MTVDPEFSRPVAVARLGHSERSFEIAADGAECQALAERYGIVAVGRLEASVHLSLAGSGVVCLKGHLRADVVQTCVVSLEPVGAHIDEAFERTYSAAPARHEDDVVVDVDGDDPPDPIINGIVDIGEAVAEQLALVLDPFPRKPGAVFESPVAPEAPMPERRRGAFDALANLRKK